MEIRIKLLKLTKLHNGTLRNIEQKINEEKTISNSIARILCDKVKSFNFI